MTNSTKRISLRRLLTRARAAYRRSVQSVALVEATRQAMYAADVMAVSPLSGLRQSSSPGAISSFEKCSFHREEGCLAAPASVLLGAPPLPQFDRSVGSCELSSGAKA